MAEACQFKDPAAQAMCLFFESREVRASGPVPIDVGVTRTDFSDPLHPVSRYIAPAGSFTPTASDGVMTDLEYFQAAIGLKAMELGDACYKTQVPGADAGWPFNALAAMKANGIRAFWLSTDTCMSASTSEADAAARMKSYIEKADEIWRGTESIADIDERKIAYAKALYEKMSLKPDEGGFDITFFNPAVDKEVKNTGHPIYSSFLDCLGPFLYGILCERRGIKFTPVQRFTDTFGNQMDHLLVGLSLDPKDDKSLTLVSFQGSESKFGVEYFGKSTWAPISRLELLAYIHIARALDIFANDKREQFKELSLALRYAPHNYFVQFNMGAWYWNDGDRAKALEHFGRSKGLNPRYGPTIEALRVASHP